MRREACKSGFTSFDTTNAERKSLARECADVDCASVSIDALSQFRCNEVVRKLGQA